MKRILKIGMDVHTTNFTLCAMESIIGEDDRVFATIKVTPDYKNILMFIENLKLKLGLNDEYDIQCGYEAVIMLFIFRWRMTILQNANMLNWIILLGEKMKCFLV